MTPQPSIRGVWCAMLTPLDPSGAIDDARFAAHARSLMAQGVDGVAPFGTTGEGQSFSVAERIAGLDALIAGGVPPDRIVAATGCAALADTIALTRARRGQQLPWRSRAAAVLFQGPVGGKGST